MKFIALILIALCCFNPLKLPDNTIEHELIIFEGSDWCTNCHSLNKKILSTTPFKEYIKDSNIRLVKVDFPQRKKQSKEEIERNIQLAEKYKFDGNFPTIVISVKNKNEYKTLTYSSFYTYNDLQLQISEFISEQN